MFAYMLILYYKNDKVVPAQVNQMMELEFALAIKALMAVRSLGQNYFRKNPSHYEPEIWQTFKDSSSYEELQKILMKDYKVLEK